MTTATAQKMRMDLRIDLRRRRAQMLVAEIFRTIEPYLQDRTHRHVHDELFELFYQKGVEVITDMDRVNCGLPPRDEYGMTAEELYALEKRRLEIMLQPIYSPIVRTETAQK